MHRKSRTLSISACKTCHSKHCNVQHADVGIVAVVRLVKAKVQLVSTFSSGKTVIDIALKRMGSETGHEGCRWRENGRKEGVCTCVPTRPVAVTIEHRLDKENVLCRGARDIGDTRTCVGGRKEARCRSQVRPWK